MHAELDRVEKVKGGVELIYVPRYIRIERKGRKRDRPTDDAHR